MAKSSLRRSASPHGPERWMPCQTGRGDCSCPNHLAIPAADIPPNFSTCSSLHRLTKTNERPTTVEEISIRDNISKLEAHQRALMTYSENLEALHAEAYEQIACIEMEMKRVAGAQVAAGRAVLEHKTALSPIRRVPPEILLLIFEQAMVFPIRTYLHSCRESICSETNILWTLELVCRSWKSTISNSSHLWSFVVVNLVHCMYPYYMRRLAKQVSRLGLTTGPISVSISSERSRDAVPIQITAILLPLIPRVKELYLHMSPSSLDSFKLWTHSLSSLTRFVISRHRYRHGEAIQTIPSCDVFHSAAKLVFVEMVDAFGPEEPYMLPWGQLVQYTSTNTHVDCTRSDCWACPQPHKFLRMLNARLTPKLQKCSFLLRNASKPTDFYNFELPVVSDMRSLTLSAPPVALAHTALEQFADSIHLPCLTELTVELSMTGKPRSQTTVGALQSIASMLERAQHALTFFTLRHCHVLPPVLAQILRVVPFLQELRLEDVEGVLTDETLLLLTPVPVEGVKILVPQLRTFRSSGVMRFSNEALAKMFKARTARTPFQSVEVCWHVEEAGLMRKRQLKMKI